MRYGASLCSGVAIMTASFLLLLLSPFAVEGSATSATMRFMEHLHGSEGRGGSLDRGGAEAQQIYVSKRAWVEDRACTRLSRTTHLKRQQSPWFPSVVEMAEGFYSPDVAALAC
ncbi:unnamed protein product [Pylaiella littoralis]